MTITKAVIDDLMPLYLAGEASPDSCRLVEEYLRDHPGERPPGDPLTLPPVAPPARTEMDSLRRTRDVYRRRTSALAGALATSYAIFSFRFSTDDGLKFILYRDMPLAASVLLAVAAGIWIHFLVMHRRWVATGLPGSSTLTSGVWLMGGAFAVLPYAFFLSYRFGLDDVLALCVIGAFAGLAIGRALHRRPAGR